MANYSSFSNQDFDNPFQPPESQKTSKKPTSSSQANLITTSVKQIDDSGINDYTPFEKKDQPATLPTNGSDFQPIYPTSYGMIGGQMNTDDLERRQKELETREQELRIREEEIRQQSKQLGSSNKFHNWPPLPACFPIGPCFYQDFDVDIPVEYRRLVRNIYYIWIGHALVFTFNIIAAIAYLIGSTNKTEAGSTFGLSIIFAVLFVPLSYTCWFRPLYKAFKNDSSFFFFLFFIIFAIQILFLLLQALGINFFAGCGWINGIGTAANNLGAGIVMLISACGFTCLVILDLFILIKVHRIYRGSGASFQKAREEFSRGVIYKQTSVGTNILSNSLSNTSTGLRY